MFRTSQTICRLSSRRTLALRPARRCIATQPIVTQPIVKGTGPSHVVAGVAGGAAVMLGAYGYYRYSGAAQVVDAAKTTVNAAKSIQEKAPSPSAAGKAIVNAIKAISPGFVSVIPGLEDTLNRTFDQLDELAEAHGDEVNELIHKLYADLQALGHKGFTEETMNEAVEILKKRMKEIGQLASSIGSDATDKVLAANPELKKAIGSGLDELKELVDVPEAEKILHDTYSELKKMAEKGFTPETVLAAGTLVKTQVSKAKEIAGQAGDVVFDKLAAGAKPFLDKMPEVQKLLDGKLGDLKKIAKENGGPELEKIVTDLYAELKKISEKGVNKKSIAEASKLVEDKIGEAMKLGGNVAAKASDFAWDKAVKTAGPYLDKMPEVQKLIEGKADDLKKIAKENGGPELEKIATDLFSELKKISEKGVNKKSLAEAKKITEEKLAEASKIAEKVGGKVWQKAADTATPLLEKSPELKKLVDSSIGDIKAVADKREEGQELLRETYEKIAKVAEKGMSKSALSDLKKIMAEQSEKAKKLKDDVQKSK